MKICFLADAKSIHVIKWVSYFVERNHEVHIISFRKARIPGAILHCLPTAFAIQTMRLLSPFGKLGYLFYLKKARTIIREISPDILHAHWATSYGLMGVYSDHHPYILSTWGRDIFDFPRQSPFHKKLLKYIIRKADYVTATSSMLTDETKKYVLGEKPVYTIPFGVDCTLFKPKPKKKKNKIIIGIVKSLEKKYGVEYLIKAFALVLKSHQNILLLIVGEGSLKKRLIRLCRRLKIEEHVIFTGFIENHRIPDFINKMDIFIIPSISDSETFGVAAVEAAACQLPVIASDIGGLPEVVIHNKTGFLVPPRNLQAIADRIIQLITDTKLRRRMGKDARRRVKKDYEWTQNGQQMEHLYQTVLKR